MDESTDIFYDHLGNFQWSSVAAFISLLVLSAQVFQFFYQQRIIIKNKKIDMLIEFRMSSLKEVKEAVLILTNIANPEAKKIDKTLLNETNVKININLNINNAHVNILSDCINNYVLFASSLEDEEIEKGELILKHSFEWAGKVLQMTENYQIYEKKEIEKINTYK